VLIAAGLLQIAIGAFQFLFAPTVTQEIASTLLLTGGFTALGLGVVARDTAISVDLLKALNSRLKEFDEKAELRAAPIAEIAARLGAVGSKKQS